VAQEGREDLPASPKRRVIEQFDGYFGLESLPGAHDDSDMPKYPPGYHHFNLAGTELLKQARRGDADLRASGRVPG